MQLAGMPLRDQQPSKYQSQGMKMKSCTKFQRSKSNKEINSSRAIIFNCLREDGCDKQSAITFCTKNVCKFDSTKMTDGPRNFRIMKVKSEKDKVLNGWYQEQPRYIMQKKYTLSVDDFLQQQDEETQKFQQEVEKQQSKIQEEYKEKIKNIQKYYKDLNQKYSLQTESHEELKNRIKQFRSELANKQQQCYVAHGSMKLYGLGEQVKSRQENRHNLIEQAQVFNHLGVDIQQIVEDDEYNFIDNRQDDEVYQQVLNKQYEKHDTQQKEMSNKSTRSKKVIDTNTKGLMNQKYIKLLEKSKVLSNLMKLEEYSEDQKASLISKQLKKRNPKYSQKNETEQINKLLKDKQQTIMLGKEFNSSKYVTQKAKKSHSQDLGSNKILERQLKQFVQDQIKNLHSDQQNDISQQQLKDLVSMRTDYKKNYLRKTLSANTVRTAKTNNYMLIENTAKTQRRQNQKFNTEKQSQKVKYQNYSLQTYKTMKSLQIADPEQSQNQSDDQQGPMQKLKLRDVK